MKLQYRQFTQGAAQDNLSQAKLLALKFLVPDDVTEQTRIADFIATYDDLIENNRRRIQLLEESARLIYQEWFVQLRFPAHEQVKINDGVPEGWEKKPLKQIATLNYGKALKAEVRVPGHFLFMALVEKLEATRKHWSKGRVLWLEERVMWEASIGSIPISIPLIRSILFPLKRAVYFCITPFKTYSL